MNGLNEKLRFIRVQLQLYNMQLKRETDDAKRIDLSEKIEILSEEENTLLEQIGAFDI